MIAPRPATKLAAMAMTGPTPKPAVSSPRALIAALWEFAGCVVDPVDAGEPVDGLPCPLFDAPVVIDECVVVLAGVVLATPYKRDDV